MVYVIQGSDMMNELLNRIKLGQHIKTISQSSSFPVYGMLK